MTAPGEFILPETRGASFEDEEDPPLAHSSGVLGEDLSFTIDSSLDARTESSFERTSDHIIPPRPYLGRQLQHHSVASSVQYGAGQGSDCSYQVREPTYVYRYANGAQVPGKTAVKYKVDENYARGNWSGRFDFILSSLGMAVGLGNVWRFPYLCYRNGGGAFFIPYFIMLIGVGVPVFFLEMSLGQFSSNGPLTCWKFAPIFKGVGVAQLITNSVFTIYYNVIIAWAIFYLIASFTSQLPWMGCDNEWNSPGCFDVRNIPEVSCSEYGTVRMANGTCYVHDTYLGVWNFTAFYDRDDTANERRILPTEEYYNNRVLDISNGIEETGTIRWELLLALLAAWTLTFLCLIKGVKSSGKVVYFTALFPYVVLFILFILGLTLENAGTGVLYYITPQWHRLGDARVWYDAAVQVFFSLGLSYGGVLTLSSYNRFHNNCLRDALIVSVANCATSIFAGFVVFSYLGFLAGQMHTTIDKVADDGPGLVFVLYPAAVTLLPGAVFWAIVFFLMLITLGLDSQFAAIEMVITCVTDQFTGLRPHKLKVTFVVNATFFLLGILLCAQSGVYWLQLIDTYAGGWGLMIMALCEVIAIGWVYGSSRYYKDIRIMVGSQPGMYWKICWQYVAPILIVFIIIFTWADYEGTKYGENYVFPTWANALGWSMSLASVCWIPGVAIYKLCGEEGTLMERVRYLSLPTEEWGPALIEHRQLVTYVKGFIVDPWSVQPSPQDKAALQRWGLRGNNNNLSVISESERWREFGGKVPSLSSLNFLPTQGVNPSYGGSQLSIPNNGVVAKQHPSVASQYSSQASLRNHGYNGSQMSLGAVSVISYESVV